MRMMFFAILFLVFAFVLSVLLASRRGPQRMGEWPKIP